MGHIMKSPWMLSLALAAGLAVTAGASPAPVNPNATPEARKLLGFLYDIKGHYTIAAQHN